MVIDYLKLYLLTISVFFAVDLLRWSLVARGFSQKSLALLLRPTVNRPVASFFDGLYLVGITLFALRPALDPVGIRHGEPT